MNRNVFLAAFLCLAVVAIISSASTQAELTSPRPGPYSLKGHRLWQVGPMLQGTVFNIPETDALGRTTVLRYMAVYGATRLEIFHDGAWKTFLEGNGRFSPGFKMPGGSYRVIRESSNNPWVAYGYMASPPPNNYSAIDEYPDSSRLWTFHSLMAGSLEFTVPATKVYMLTMISSGNRIDRFEGGSWVTYADGDLPYTLEPPGIRLPAGQYRMEQSSPTAPVWCGGYVTTES